MNIIDSLKWRYATKKFNPEKTLTSSQIQTIKEAFNLTATSYGLQPLKLVIIHNKEIQKELVQHSWNQQQVADASHLLVFCIENTVDEAYIDQYFARVKAIRNTPDEILNPFKEFMMSSFNDKTTEWIKTWCTKQAYIAMGNLLTVCATEKIDACPMEGFIPDAYDKVLQLQEKGLSSVLVMPIGYRADDDMFSEFKKVRKQLSESILEVQ